MLGGLLGWIILGVWLTAIGFIGFWSAFIMSGGTLFQRKNGRIRDLEKQLTDLKQEHYDVVRQKNFYYDRYCSEQKHVKRLIALTGFDSDDPPDYIIQEAPEQQTAPLKVTA